MYQFVIEPIYFWVLVMFLLIMYAGTALVLYLHFTGGISFQRSIEKLLNKYVLLTDKKLKDYSTKDVENLRNYIEERLYFVEQFETKHYERIKKISDVQDKIIKELLELQEKNKNKDKTIIELQKKYQETLESIKEKNGIIERKNRKINLLRKKISELENAH